MISIYIAAKILSQIHTYNNTQTASELKEMHP